MVAVLIKTTPTLRSADVTDERDYLSRREFVASASGAALAAAGVSTFGWLGSSVHAQTPLTATPSPLSTDEKPNSFEDITSYNNFYEFGTDKEDPARYASEMTTTPWSVRVEGHTGVPDADYALEDILKPHPLEERIYRLRCVEAWSMVVPGSVFRLAISSSGSSRHRRRVSFGSKPCIGRASCAVSVARCCSGRTSRRYGWTRRCTR